MHMNIDSTDDTNRNETPEATRVNDEVFRRVFEHALTGIAITDMQGKFEQCNPAYTALLGYTEQELRALRFSELVHPEDHEANMKQIRRLVSGEISDFIIENRYLHKSGDTLWVRKYVSCLPGENGQPERIMALVNDMTERKQADMALRESEARYRAVVETAVDGFWMLDGKGNIIATNDAYARRSGYSQEQLLKMHITDVEVNEDSAAVRRHMDHILRFGSHIFESRHRASDGSIWPVEVHVSFWESAGEHYCAFLRDMSERKALEREIIEVSTAEQERIGRDIHDGLGQQLTGLGILASAIERDLRRDGEEQSAKIVSELRQHLQAALDQARAMARGLSPVEIAPEGLAQALVDLAARVSTSGMVDCRYKGTRDLAVIEDLEDIVVIHLFRIAQEAVQNALKHAQATRIEVDLYRDSEALVLTVLDNGKGIDASIEDGDHMGLKIMHYRAGIIGGKLTICPQHGTLVRCEVPLGCQYVKPPGTE